MTDIYELSIEDMSRYVLRSVATGVMVMDVASKIVYMNRAAEVILEETLDDIQGKHLLELPRFHPIIPVITSHRRYNPSLTVSHRQFETWLERKDGTRLPVGFSVANLVDDDDTVLGYTLVFRDLTEVKELEEKARRSERLALLGTMAAGVAHEIRNPLHAMKGALELVSMKLKRGKPVDRYMEILESELERLESIVNDILGYAREVRPELKWERMQERLPSLADRLALPDGVKLVFDVPDDLPPVLVDWNKLLQVFINLVQNAAQAMQGRGTITVRASVSRLPEGAGADDTVGDEFLLVEVEDEGPGIPAGKLSSVFQPFFTTKGSKGGTGLGLAICQKIVEAHQGYIDVVSEEGRGATFRVFLPLRSMAANLERLGIGGGVERR